MTEAKQNCLTRLLIVDDELSIRTSMSGLLHEIGYLARTAEDGFSALAEIRKEVPDILLSDLHMARMSGFELLAVVRRRYPEVRTIAMSGAFSGNEAPSGVPADGFFQKGSSIGSLLRIMGALPPRDRMPSGIPYTPTPVWIPPVCAVMQEVQDNAREVTVSIACPECLRTFTHTLKGPKTGSRETDCIHCSSSIHYAVVPPADRIPVEILQTSSAKPRPVSTPRLSY
jgi:CheY-like chemotaxis protein